MARISTGTGDHGTTGLASGARVPKTHPRVEATGTVDEVNDLLGLAIAFLEDPGLGEALRALQEDLFVLGADLATPPPGDTMRITEEHVRRLEEWEDELEAALPPLKNFILPGGLPAAGFLQAARSVARRAERCTWRAVEAGEEVGPHALVYLNRLSDLLFLLARAVNRADGISDPEWKGRRG